MRLLGCVHLFTEGEEYIHCTLHRYLHALSNRKVAKGTRLNDKVLLCFSSTSSFSLSLPSFSSLPSTSLFSSPLPLPPPPPFPPPASPSPSSPSHRCEDAGDLQDTSQEEVEKIANEIEDRLYAIHQDITPRYKTKYRSLLFNLKDVKNQVRIQIISQNMIQRKQPV